MVPYRGLVRILHSRRQHHTLGQHTHTRDVGGHPPYVSTAHSVLVSAPHIAHPVPVPDMEGRRCRTVAACAQVSTGHCIAKA
eukprot:2149879-Rhodomonas_salina.1